MISMDNCMYIRSCGLHVLTFRHHCILYIGQAFRYSPKNAFYIFNQQIYIYFLTLAEQSQFVPLQNVVYFITLHFMVPKIFTSSSSSSCSGRIRFDSCSLYPQNEIGPSVCSSVVLCVFVLLVYIVVLV